jgi:hypothetical protein
VEFQIVPMLIHLISLFHDLLSEAVEKPARELVNG